MSVSLDDYQILGARAKACVLKTLVTVIRDKAPIYNHGMTAKEVDELEGTVKITQQ